MLEIAIAMVKYVFIIGVIGLSLWAMYAALVHLAFEKADKVQDKVDAVFEKMDAVSDQMDKARRGRLLRQLGFPRRQFRAPIGLTVFAPRKKDKSGQRTVCNVRTERWSRER